ncbi:helix-turn-helix domain-containing protein [Hoyosella altamirensis]|uniref:AraC-like DNA-binding protein n=1 Tax=Hoyosella altamirensis TaxID=616997 RepID=A0A839RJ39_9ACTN|nr:helix-turn-helix domain-containing protein [Hoyosella altamirensis]MBB3036685.1 AraC-like DNA-binding protein [Hoyosella altamirensis]
MNAPQSRGPVKLDRRVQIERHAPSAAVADLVRHYWIAHWALPPGEEAVQQVLTYPACNIVIEAGEAGLYGPSQGLSVRTLRGNSSAFGVLLRPSAGHLLTGRSPADFGEAVIPLPGGGTDAVADVREKLHHQDIGAAVAAFEEWIAPFAGNLTKEHRLVNRIVDLAEQSSGPTRVADLSVAVNVSERTLQRLVLRVTGVTPKWLLHRRRLQDAAHLLNSLPGKDLTELAAELGYADYAHFSRDFAATVGLTPRQFVDSQSSAIS